MGSTGLRLQLFGPMLVLVNGETIPRLRSRKALWLMALLSMRANRAVSREWVATTLWPDARLDVAFATLRPIVSELRQALGEQRGRLQSLDRNNILLDLQGAEVDVAQFDAAVQARDYALVAGLYGGPLLEGCPEEWVTQERLARQRDCIRALECLADSARRNEDYESAAENFSRLLQIDPLCDSAYRGLMEVSVSKGDINSALQIYRRFAHHLISEVGSVPDPETTDFYDRLRARAKDWGSTLAAPKREISNRTERRTDAMPFASSDPWHIADKLRSIASAIEEGSSAATQGRGTATIEFRLQLSISPAFLERGL
jgi:DNA-binding SARP family transcriptional activator